MRFKAFKKSAKSLVPCAMTHVTSVLIEFRIAKNMKVLYALSSIPLNLIVINDMKAATVLQEKYKVLKVATMAVFHLINLISFLNDNKITNTSD